MDEPRSHKFNIWTKKIEHQNHQKKKKPNPQCYRHPVRDKSHEVHLTRQVSHLKYHTL